MTSKRPRIASAASQRRQQRIEISPPDEHPLAPEERRGLESMFWSIARDEYGIDPHDPDADFKFKWALLAEKYPERRTRGRKQKWTPVMRVMLAADIEELLGQRISVVDARRQLAKREPWKSLLGPRGSAETLRRVYYAFRKRVRSVRVTLEKMLWTTYQSDKKLGRLEEWEADIAEAVRKFRKE
jgi:hypothetical protein